jgi:hypothetical protein
MVAVWLCLGVVALAVVKAVAERRDEAAAFQYAVVTAALEVEQKEESLLAKEERQAMRDATKELRQAKKDEQKEARQQDVFSFWEAKATFATPLVFTIERREVGARVVAVQPKGIVIQDGIEACAYLAYEKLLWWPGSEADLRNPDMGIVPPDGWGEDEEYDGA